MKSLFHVYYHRGDKNFTRQEYAFTYNEAKDQASEHFKMFGYGDEVIFYVEKF